MSSPSNRVHHFPKWLWRELFELAYENLRTPQRPYCFCIRLFHSGSRFNFSTGYGNSIAEAAKAARQKRETEQ